MNRPKAIVLLLLILFPAILRVTDHPWNFAAVGAMALFAGACFRDKSWAFFVPIAAMFLSDVAMGWLKNDWKYAFHALLPVIYLCYLINVMLGIGLRRLWSTKSRTGNGSEVRRNASRGFKTGTILFGSLAGSVIFYFITNFAVWAMFTTYPHTGVGLLECYEAGLPYFRTTVAADLIFAAAFFGGFALLRGNMPVLRESQLLYAE